MNPLTRTERRFATGPELDRIFPDPGSGSRQRPSCWSMNCKLVVAVAGEGRFSVGSGG